MAALSDLNYYNDNIFMLNKAFASPDVSRESKVTMLFIDKFYSLMNHAESVPTPNDRNLDHIK